MAGLVDGKAVMSHKLVGLGMQGLTLDADDFTAHTFHHSQLTTSLEPITYGIRQRGNNQGEAVYREKCLIATYLHLYFPSNPEGAASLFK